MSRTGAHAFLYAQSRDLHDRLDSHPLLHKLVSPALDSIGYAEALQSLQLCLEPAEAAITAFEPLLEAALPVPYTPRSPWLERDLQALGHTTLPAPLVQPAALADQAAYLGYRYVLEGAALGTTWILKNMRKQEIHIDNAALNYLRGQEAMTQGWPAFVDCLNENLTSAEHLQQAAMAARNLFRYFCSTLDSRYTTL